jgi:TRAP-type mannitol/chloroaromatic compound transport system permease large subunit
MTMSLLLFAFTVVLLAVGFPVGFALAGATLAAVGLGSDFPLVVVLKEMFVGIDSFALLAVPFFILAAELMSGGSLTEVLLRFASQFVGHLRGGLATPTSCRCPCSRASAARHSPMPPGPAPCSSG